MLQRLSTVTGPRSNRGATKGCWRRRERTVGVQRRLWSVPLITLLTAAGTPAVAAADDRTTTSEPLPLERLFDNRAVSDDARPGEADFDGAGNSLSAQDLTAAGWTPGRAPRPSTAPGCLAPQAARQPDNVRADGQQVRVRGPGDALAFLVAGTARRPGGDVTGTRHGALPGRHPQHVHAHRPRLARRPARHQGGGAAAREHPPGGQLAEKAKAVRRDRAGRAGPRDRLRDAPGRRRPGGPACVRAVGTRPAVGLDGELGGEHAPATRPSGPGRTGRCGSWCTPRRAGRGHGSGSTTPSRRRPVRIGQRDGRGAGRGRERRAARRCR